MTNLELYSAALDEAWQSIEQAISKTKELNDLVWAEGELPEDTSQRVPAADVALLVARIRELEGEIKTFDAAKAAV